MSVANVDRWLKIRSCSCSAGSGGENCTSPLPRSTSAGDAAGRPARQTPMPDAIVSVRSGALIDEVLDGELLARVETQFQQAVDGRQFVEVARS